MMSTLRLLLGSLLVLAPACGAANPAPPPPPSPSADASPTTTAAPTSPEATAAPATGVQASPHDRDDPDGVRRWTSWDGPTQGEPVKTKRAWVMGPNLMGQNLGDKSSFASVYPRLVEVVSSNADELVFVEQAHRYGVPASLALPAFTGKASRGSVARCTFGGNSVVGRITDVKPESVTCTFFFIGKVKNEELRHDEVLPLGDSLAWGAVVHARFEAEPDAWYPGILARIDGERAWVLLDTKFGEGHPMAGHPLHETKAAALHAVDPRKTLAVGAPCLAAKLGTLEACKVAKALEGGLGYEVSFDGGAPETFEDLGSVTAPHE